LEAAERLSFTPNFFAQSLISKRTKLLGVLIEDGLNTGLTHPLFAGIVEGFKRATEARGYELLLIKSEYIQSPETVVTHCRQRGIEGVLLVVCNSGNRSVWALNESMPCVSVDTYADNLTTVLSDNERGGALATEYLIKAGHRRIAHIAGNNDKPAGADRREGYRKAMLQAGIKPNNLLIRQTVSYESDEGGKAVHSLLDEGADFSAIFAASDSLAYGAVAALRERGLSVPGDISVIGFDDIDTSAYFSPPLTTIRQDRDALGVNAGDLLVDLVEGGGNGDESGSIGGGAAARHVYFPVELIERESVGRGA
jgi:LacI family transcriptional regulator